MLTVNMLHALQKHRTKVCVWTSSVFILGSFSSNQPHFEWYLKTASRSGNRRRAPHSLTCETAAHRTLFQWSRWSFLIEKHKSSILCFSMQRSLCIMHCLFRWLMIQEEPSILLLLCCTFSPPRPTRLPASLEDSVWILTVMSKDEWRRVS